ncbi:heavy-metal-associated domain-containing protein [Pseudonocardia sp. NPDC049635]|uniref:heavy-metal-associated domain-containing protein n=1 Tax=Pseudonocardia sp. NPDC049635 TaxID=3155506 RepID=UPI0033D1DE75
MSSIEYTVSGMSCGHCEASVREEVSRVAGVADVEVSAQTGRLVITAEQSDRPVDDAAVIAAVADAGYAAARS